jgi:mRNA interferase RelE/StbE
MNDAFYHIEFSSQALRDLEKAPAHAAARAAAKIKALAENPRPSRCRKLQGFERRYRVRVGDWRVIYDIYDKALHIIIVSFPPRGSAYD